MNVANHRKLLTSVSREFSAKIKNGKHFLYFEDKEVAEKIRNQRHCSKRRVKGSGAKKFMILRKISVIVWGRKQFRSCSTYKRTHALVTMRFYDLLEQSSSRHGTKLVWLTWELKKLSFLKTDNMDTSWLLSMFSVALFDFVCWRTNLVF